MNYLYLMLTIEELREYGSVYGSDQDGQGFVFGRTLDDRWDDWVIVRHPYELDGDRTMFMIKHTAWVRRKINLKNLTTEYDEIVVFDEWVRNFEPILDAIALDDTVPKRPAKVWRSIIDGAYEPSKGFAKIFSKRKPGIYYRQYKALEQSILSAAMGTGVKI